jgi:hypothetical protein
LVGSGPRKRVALQRGRLASNSSGYLGGRHIRVSFPWASAQDQVSRKPGLLQWVEALQGDLDWDLTTRPLLRASVPSDIKGGRAWLDPHGNRRSNLIMGNWH